MKISHKGNLLDLHSFLQTITFFSLSSKAPFTLQSIFDASSPTCSFHSFLKDAAKAMDDMYFAITGSILGHWMLLAALQMAQQSSTKEKKGEEVVLSYVMKTAERVSVL